MALTVSDISATFVEDTKTIGKQSAYLEFDFGGKVHSTDVLKKAGKAGTWDTPVQLTGAGINMKVIARASKTLGHDKVLGASEINVVEAVGRGTQTVRLTHETTGEPAGEVTLRLSGGSRAISGLPHTEDHLKGAAAAALPGHQSTETTGAGGQGVGGQGVGGGHSQGHHGAGTAGGLGAAAAGAAGLAAGHHHGGGGNGEGLSGRGLTAGDQQHLSSGYGGPQGQSQGYSTSGQQGGYNTSGQQGGSGFGGGQQGLTSGGQQGMSTGGQQGGYTGVAGDHHRGGTAAALGAGAAGLAAGQGLGHHGQQHDHGLRASDLGGAGQTGGVGSGVGSGVGQTGGYTGQHVTSDAGTGQLHPGGVGGAGIGAQPGGNVHGGPSTAADGVSSPGGIGQRLEQNLGVGNRQNPQGGMAQPGAGY